MISLRYGTFYVVLRVQIKVFQPYRQEKLMDIAKYHRPRTIADIDIQNLFSTQFGLSEVLLAAAFLEKA